MNSATARGQGVWKRLQHAVCETACQSRFQAAFCPVPKPALSDSDYQDGAPVWQLTMPDIKPWRDLIGRRLAGLQRFAFYLIHSITAPAEAVFEKQTRSADGVIQFKRKAL